MSDEEEHRQVHSSVVVEQPVRFRSRMRQVLNFSNVRVDRPLCMPDKLSILFREHRITCQSRTRLLQFLRSISGSHSLLTDIPATQRIKCKFRKSYCPFLYGSYFIINEDSRSPGSYFFKIFLTFNPSRYLANMEGVTRSDDHFVYFNRNINRNVKAIALDRNDNFINYEYSAIRNYLNHEEVEEGNPTLMGFLEELTDWMENYLTSRSNFHGVWFDFNWSNWSLTHSEIYYEFASRDAFQFLKYITPHIPALYQETLFRHYIHDIDEGGGSSQISDTLDVTQKDNSMMISIPLGNKLTLAIYPKTSEIVRFEIRRKVSLRAALYAIMPDHPLLFMDHIEWQERRSRINNSIGNGLANIPEILTVFGNHLANIIETIYSNIHSRIGTQTQDYDIVPAFIRALDVCSPSRSIADSIWASFAANGYIRTDRNPRNRVMLTLRRMCNQTTYVIMESGFIVGERSYVFRLCPELLATLRSLRLDPTLGRLDELSAEHFDV